MSGAIVKVRGTLVSSHRSEWGRVRFATVVYSTPLLGRKSRRPKVLTCVPDVWSSGGELPDIRVSYSGVSTFWIIADSGGFLKFRLVFPKGMISEGSID